MMKLPMAKPGTSRENKTGSWRSQKPIVKEDGCIKCGICVKFCPEGCISGPPENVAKIDYDYCKGCGICVSECPKKTIEMVIEE